MSEYICPRCNQKLHKVKSPVGNRVLVCFTDGCTYYATIAEWRARNVIEAYRAEVERLTQREAALTAERDLCREALVAMREWLWSGSLMEGQKRGQPIIAPREVSDKFNAALDVLDGQP